jgi:hypothetical protein
MVTAALPPDVRKACGFPIAQLISAGLRPMEAEPPSSWVHCGKAEPFRTSGGEAAISCASPARSKLRLRHSNA